VGPLFNRLEGRALDDFEEADVQRVEEADAAAANRRRFDDWLDLRESLLPRLGGGGLDVVGHETQVMNLEFVPSGERVDAGILRHGPNELDQRLIFGAPVARQEQDFGTLVRILDPISTASVADRAEVALGACEIAHDEADVVNAAEHRRN
jgi:hypothetical protein